MREIVEYHITNLQDRLLEIFYASMKVIVDFFTDEYECGFIVSVIYVVNFSL